MQVEGEAALEQDDRDGHGDQGRKQLTQQGLGADPAQAWSNAEPQGEQWQDRGDPHPPGEPLGADPGGTQDEDLQGG